jgi:molecular chaperone Hsp33
METVTMSEEFVDEFVKVESIFVRHRNCHLLRAHFSPMYTDYYLHLMQYGLRNEEPCDSMLKDLLAYFTLYLVARPWAEQHAWTVNLKSPGPANLFVTGSSLTESVVGRAFVNDIRIPENNLFYAQMYKDGREIRSSVIDIKGDTPAEWVEEFYQQSEQRLARCLELPDECFTMVTAQPDADEEWLGSLTVDMMKEIDSVEETKLLETRKFKFNCGCNIGRILPTLKAMEDKLDELFAGEKSLEVTCPRCGAVYPVTRDMIEKKDGE